MNSYDLVLFDMDGTLLDSGTAHYEMFERYWTTSDENTGEDLIKKNAGPTIYDVLRPMGITKAEMPRIYAELATFYQRKVPDIVSRLRFIPEAEDVLERLADAGVVTGLVTNTHWALMDEILKLNEAQTWFDIVSGSTAEQEDKRERMLQIISEQGTPKGGVLYVGDNESDARTAQAIGVDCCIVVTEISWIRSLDTLMRELRPTYAICSLKNLVNIVI